MNRESRIQAFELIAKQADAGIIKDAQIVGSVIEFLKSAFSDFYNSIKSMWNPDSPILSILELLTVGAITARSKVLGVLIAALGLFLGINVETIFSTMSNMMKPYLSSGEGQQKLNENPDAVLTNVATTAVNSQLQATDEEVDRKIADGAKTTASDSIYSQKINKFAVAKNVEIEKIAKFSIGGMLPSLFGVFGKGRKGIVGVFYWILKSLLLGAGVIGVTGAAAAVVGVKPKGVTSTVKPPTTTTDVEPDIIVGQFGPKLLPELKIASNSSITTSRFNDAPDTLNDQNRTGRREWVADNPTGNFADVLYDWTLGSYTNLGDVFVKNNIKPEQLRYAAEKVANTFRFANKSMSEYVIRIPQRYKTVKNVVEEVIRSI